MFKKLFGREDAPTNEGIPDLPAKIERVRWVKIYQLELSNMEGNPVYDLKHQLTVGSEIGNIIVSDPSVSPRHCTFILQENLISVIDHGSISGTMVNGKKIPPGRYIILEETDVVHAGELEMKILVKQEAIPDDVPEIPIPMDEDEIEEEEVIVVQPKTKPKLVKTLAPSNYAANSLVRVAAVLCDLLLSYSILVVLLPFDDFKHLLDYFPQMLGEALNVDWPTFWDTIKADFGFIGEMLEDLYGFISITFHFSGLFITFFMVRFISTLFLGVSLSEAILGIRADGNGIWKRVGGAIRVIIGIITGPLIVLDLPAVVSRRTFKEVLTQTRIYLHSKFITTLGIILYFPFLIFLALIAPLFQGFEPPLPIMVNEKVEQRVKVAEAGAEQIKPLVIQSSRYLKIQLPYSPENISVIPMFKFHGVKAKLNYRPQVVFYHKDLQQTVAFELMKTFDLKQLMGFGMRGNIFLYDKYPELYNFVYSASENNPLFPTKKGQKENAKFANEFMSFTKVALELNPHNAFEVMQESTPLIKGLMDFKTSFLSLLEYKDFDQIGFIKIGDAHFIRMSYLKQKPFDLLIPMLKDEGRIYKVTFEKKENLKIISNKFYKFTLEKADWLPATPKIGEIMTPFDAIDFFSDFSARKKDLNQAYAQALYGYYYEQSALILKAGDTIEMELWLNSLNAILRIVEGLPKTVPIGDAGTNTSQKLLQNFKDLKDAFESRNKTYFSIEESVTI